MQNPTILQWTMHRTPFKGRGNFIPVLRKCTETLLQQCRFQKFSREKYPGPVLRARKIYSRSPKIHQNSPTVMHNSKIFPGTIPPTFVSGTGTLVFVLRKCTKTLLQQCRKFKNKSGGRTPESPFLGSGEKSCLLLKLCLATPLCPL